MPQHIYKRKGSDRWWIDIKVKGRRRIRRSSGTSVRKLAEDLAETIEAQEWDRLVKGDPATLTFAEAVKLYLADGHKAQYLKPLVTHFKDTRVASIKAGHIRAACRVLYPKAKAATWNRQVITPARAVINHAAGKDLAAFIKVERFPELKPVRPIPAVDWLERFIEAAPANLGALALFMRITGARIGQAVDTEWADIDLGAGTAIIPAAKGFPERRAQLTQEMVTMLANLPEERKGRVFGYIHRWSVYKGWRRVCNAAGLPYITSHLTGRRGFFTAMARAGFDPKTAGQLGGLSSPRLVLGIYTEANTDPGIISSVFENHLSQSKRTKAFK